MEPSAAALSEFSTLSANNSATMRTRSATFDLPTWISLNPELDHPGSTCDCRRFLSPAKFYTLAKLIDTYEATGSVEASPAKEIVWFGRAVQRGDVRRTLEMPSDQ